MEERNQRIAERQYVQPGTLVFPSRNGGRGIDPDYGRGVLSNEGFYSLTEGSNAMTNFNQETPVNTIYAEGAPVGDGYQGARWVDTLTDTPYEFYGGAWHALGGGGGGGGLPYTATYYGWYVDNYSLYPTGLINFTAHDVSAYAYNNIFFGNSYSDFTMQGAGNTIWNGNGLYLNAANYLFFACSKVYLPSLPGAPGPAGSLWNNAGVVTIA